jgi:hypothetical protein
VLYAILLGIPRGHEKTLIANLGLKANPGTIASVELVGNTEKVRWTQRPDALVIESSASYPADYAVVYRVRFKAASL